MTETASFSNQNSFVKNYFYSLLARYFCFFILPHSKVLIAGDSNPLFEKAIRSSIAGKVDARTNQSGLFSQLYGENPDYILLNGTFHREQDIQSFLEKAYDACGPDSRLIVAYFSSLWKPIFDLASKLGLRHAEREVNWVSPSDVKNLCQLTRFEIVASSSRILLPVWIPVMSEFVNKWISPLPFFRFFNLVNIAVLRPQKLALDKDHCSVSIVVPARNEQGNIESAILRIPQMGPRDEIIFIEGNSTDETWKTIQEMKEKYDGVRRIRIAQQDGKGKGDAVRKGFAMAENDIFMILDADLTVPPEELPKFYSAIISGVGDFINGSRLVYPMEQRAMRFLNMVGNRFFAVAFSFLLGQEFKDTLCGTKVVSRRNYLKIVSNRDYFKDFDPFGDFDLLFGAARSSLKIVDLPIRYRERTYGETNISRWKHGWLLLRMTLFAAKKVKFI